MSFFTNDVLGATIEFVFYNPTVIFKDNQEAITAIRSLEKGLSKELNSKVKGYYFQKELDLRRFIENSKPVFGFFDVRYFVEHYKQEKMVPLLIPQRNKKTSAPFLIIVRKDSGINTVLDLKGKTFATTRKGAINNNFLSNIVFEQLINAGKYFNVKWVDTSKSAIMALFYKEVDVAVVDKIFFDTDIAQKEHFKILFSTKEIIFAPVCLFKKNEKPELTEKLENAFLQLHRQRAAKAFNDALKIDRWLVADHKTYVRFENLLVTPAMWKKPYLTKTNATNQQLKSFPIKVIPEPVQIFALFEEPRSMGQ